MFFVSWLHCYWEYSLVWWYLSSLMSYYAHHVTIVHFSYIITEAQLNMLVSIPHGQDLSHFWWLICLGRQEIPLLLASHYQCYRCDQEPCSLSQALLVGYPSIKYENCIRRLFIFRYLFVAWNKLNAFWSLKTAWYRIFRQTHHLRDLEFFLIYVV